MNFMSLNPPSIIWIKNPADKLKILQVVSYVLQTMDPSNLVMRKVCLHTSMLALREIARVFPMIALNGRATRLAVGDAIGDIHSVTIHVYDVERYVEK